MNIENDEDYSVMLDYIRRGELTDETVHTLEKRVFEGSVADKVADLKESG